MTDQITDFKFPHHKVMFDYLQENLDPVDYDVVYHIHDEGSRIFVSKNGLAIFVVKFEAEGKIFIEFLRSTTLQNYKDKIIELVDRCPQISPENDHFYEEILVSP